MNAYEAMMTQWMDAKQRAQWDNAHSEEHLESMVAQRRDSGPRLNPAVERLMLVMGSGG